MPPFHGDDDGKRAGQGEGPAREAGAIPPDGRSPSDQTSPNPTNPALKGGCFVGIGEVCASDDGINGSRTAHLPAETTIQDAHLSAEATIQDADSMAESTEQAEIAPVSIILLGRDRQPRDDDSARSCAPGPRATHQAQIGHPRETPLDRTVQPPASDASP